MQKELAQLVGVTPQSITFWKQGVVRPETVQLQKLAKWAGVDYLMLRALVDKVPPNSPGLLGRDPRVEAIAAMLDSIIEDDVSLAIALDMLKGIVDRSPKARR